MKNIATASLLLLLACAAASSQSGWFWQNPLPQGNDLNAVKTISSTIISAVGSYGTIIRSTDGGGTWKIQSVPTRNVLYGVDFTSSTNGFAVGTKGTIVGTIDGGTTWSLLNSGTTKALYGIDAYSVSYAIAVGASGTILRTTDGGSTWTTPTSGVTTTLYSVSILRNNATIVGDLGTILHSTDGGATWTKQTSNTTVTLNSVWADTLKATAVGTKDPTDGQGVILRTTDGGTTWSRQTSGVTENLFSVSMSSTEIGTTVGQYGDVLRTTDGGTTWTYQSINTSMLNLNGVSFVDGSVGVCVGVHGLVFRTVTGGTGNPGWQAVFSGDPVSLYGAGFAGTLQGVAGGTGGTVFRTSDGGTTWKESRPLSQQIMDIMFIGANKILAVGWSGSVGFSADTGTTWQVRSSGVTTDLRAIAFMKGTGYIVGLGATILRTDSIATAFAIKSAPVPSTYNFYDVVAASRDTAFIVGDHGVILRSIDTGNTWIKTQLDTTVTFSGASFVSSKIGTIVGSSARIYRTTDAGVTWTQQTTTESSFAGFGSVSFFDANNGMLTSSSNILKTTNGGTSWSRVESGTSNGLYAIKMITSQTAFAIGNYGTILKTIDGGGPFITGVEREVGNALPTHFELSQNYPNPFNPSTTIRFSVSTRSRVRLAIFNLLGQRIAELANEEIGAGSREKTWNANVATGIYFYRLEAVSVSDPTQRFVDVKKMILMK